MYGGNSLPGAELTGRLLPADALDRSDSEAFGGANLDEVALVVAVSGVGVLVTHTL